MSVEAIIQKIIEETGSTGMSVSIHNDIRKGRVGIFLHTKSTVRHGVGADFDAALADAKSDPGSRKSA